MAPKVTPPAMPSACNPASTPPRQGEIETKCRVPCRNATTCPKTKTQSTFLPSANMAFLRIENRDRTPKRSPRRDLPRQPNFPSDPPPQHVRPEKSARLHHQGRTREPRKTNSARDSSFPHRDTRRETRTGRRNERRYRKNPQALPVSGHLSVHTPGVRLPSNPKAPEAGDHPSIPGKDNPRSTRHHRLPPRSSQAKALPQEPNHGYPPTPQSSDPTTLPATPPQTKCRVPHRNATTWTNEKTQSLFLPSANMLRTTTAHTGSSRGKHAGRPHPTHTIAKRQDPTTPQPNTTQARPRQYNTWPTNRQTRARARDKDSADPERRPRLRTTQSRFRQNAMTCEAKHFSP